MTEIQIKKFGPMRVAALEHRGPYPQISAVFQKVAAVFSDENLWPMVTGAAVGMYYDSPRDTPADQLRAHAGLIVGPGDLPAPLQEVILPAGRYAVLRHIGPYTGLPAAWDYLYGDWLPKSGEVAADAPPFEMNPNGPMNAEPSEFITDICLQLR